MREIASFFIFRKVDTLLPSGMGSVNWRLFEHSSVLRAGEKSVSNFLSLILKRLLSHPPPVETKKRLDMEDI